ncbi:TIGR02221 family CRISPR-associated protein [Fervidobacterium sp.]
MGKENLAIFSIIGRGRQRKDKTRGYEQTKYVFNPDSKENSYETKETAFFGIALYEYLSKKLNNVPEKFVILGTNKSAWSELLSLIPEEKQGELSTITLYDKLYNQENDENSSVSKETLEEWERLLREFIPSIRLYIIEPLDFYTYVDIILKEIDDNSTYKLVFDCTHGYRYIPIVFSYAVILAKKLRKVQQIRFFYGAFEMKEYYNIPEKTSPVVEIDAVNHLIELIEATSIYNVSGYFPNILSLIGIPDTNETYFKLEMNQNQELK